MCIFSFSKKRLKRLQRASSNHDNDTNSYNIIQRAEHNAIVNDDDNDADADYDNSHIYDNTNNKRTTTTIILRFIANDNSNQYC